MENYGPLRQEQVLQLRVQISVAFSELNTCLKHLDESRAKFMDIVPGANQPSQQKLLDEASSQLANDNKAVISWMEEWRRLNIEMSDLEMDEKAPRRPRDLTPEAIRGRPPDVRISTPEIEYNSRPRGTALNPLQEEYFDLVGDLRLEIETRDEILHEHIQRRTQRERHIDQDRSLPETEQEFAERCRVELAEVELKIDHLEPRVLDLRKRCEERGLSTDPARYVSDGESSGGQSLNNIESWLETVERSSMQDTNTLSATSAPTSDMTATNMAQEYILQSHSASPAVLESSGHHGLRKRLHASWTDDPPMNQDRDRDTSVT